jgi:hypothetical protein
MSWVTRIQKQVEEKRDAQLAAQGDADAKARIANRNPGGTLGDIYRSEWNNWIDQFLPVDRKLMDMARSNSDNRSAEELANWNTRTAFQTARRSDEMSRRGLGTSLTEDESRYLNNKSRLSEVAAIASNVNNTRLHTADRDRAIMSGGLTGGLRNLTEQTG